MVNTSTKTVSAVLPQPETAAVLLDSATSEQRSNLYANLQKGLPFLTDALPKEIEVDGVTSFEISQRYGKDQIAAHLIGYVNSEGEGVTGIEKAYNDLLSASGEETEVCYTLNGLGTALKTGDSDILKTGDDSTGVVLTIDREIQSVCENIGAKLIRQGAVVVMEPSTGKTFGLCQFSRV